MANDPRPFRVEDERFTSEPYAPDAPPKKRSAMSTCLTGCLIAFVVFVVLAIIAGVWIYRNFSDFAATTLSEGAKQIIRETDLPEQERVDIDAQIDRMATAVREGQLSMEQMAAFVQNFMQSALPTTLAMSAIDKKYIAPSGLTDQEKTEAQVTLQRFMRGAIDRKFNEAAMKQAMAPVTEERNGQIELRDTVTDEQLRQFLKNAKSEADAAEIPEEVEQVDPSDEFKRLVDEALAGKAPQAAEPVQPAAPPIDAIPDQQPAEAN